MNILIIDRDKYDVINAHTKDNYPFEPNLYKKLWFAAVRENDGTFTAYKNMITKELGLLQEYEVRDIILQSYNYIEPEFVQDNEDVPEDEPPKSA